MSKFLRSREKQLISNSNPQMNSPKQVNEQQMNSPRPINGQQINGQRPIGPQINGSRQMSISRPIVPQMNNHIPVNNNQNNGINRASINNNFNSMMPSLQNNNQRPQNMFPQQVINPNQMSTGMLNMNNNRMNIVNKPNNQPIFQQNIPNFNQMNTGMLNINTGEFIPTPSQMPQMSTGMLNINTGEFIPTPSQMPQMSTGMLNINTGEFIPQVQQMNMINPNLLQNSNPFFDPSMNTYEFDFNRNTNLVDLNNTSRSQIEFKLNELQRMHTSGLISDEEFLVKKRDLVNKALDNL
ncbi:MAG: hypothetical protein ACRCWU_00200 [Metamycoplasmataceae bacterium]